MEGRYKRKDKDVLKRYIRNKTLKENEKTY